MNTEVEKQETVQSSAYNAFPEPQTIPSGWDTSVFSAPPVATSEQADEPAESDSD